MSAPEKPPAKVWVYLELATDVKNTRFICSTREKPDCTPYIPAAKAEADLAAVQRECERLKRRTIEAREDAFRAGVAAAEGMRPIHEDQVDFMWLNYTKQLAALTPNPSPNDTRPHAV